MPQGCLCEVGAAWQDRRAQEQRERLQSMNTASLKAAGQAAVSSRADLLAEAQILSTVEEVLAATPFIDIHTHLYPPSFGKIGLWGIDELLTYHYLEAELFRSSKIKPERYWELSKREQADLIWQTLSWRTPPFRKLAAA